MSSQTVLSGTPMDLRLRAAARLNGQGSVDGDGASSSEALGVLFALATSPSTAPNALSLLHELQVHQVELELQAEELRDSRAELEAALRHQTELYDFAPVGFFTVDASTALHEMNLTGARLLGCERAAALGRRFDGFLDRRSADRLHTLLARVGEGHQGEVCEFDLPVAGGTPRAVHVVAARDPADQRFFVVLTDVGERKTKSTI